MSHTITSYYHKKMGAALQLAISDAGMEHSSQRRHSRVQCWHFTVAAAHDENTDTPDNVQGISIQ
jgi:hypothetical protein